MEFSGLAPWVSYGFYKSYKALGRMSEDSDYDSEWKEQFKLMSVCAVVCVKVSI